MRPDTHQNRPWRRMIAFWAATLVLVGLGLELGARGLYFAWTGQAMRLEQLRALRRRSIPGPVDPRPGNTEPLQGRRNPARPHHEPNPYRGYVFVPPSRMGTLNHEQVLMAGEPAREESADRLVVGIFGGSVAFDVAAQVDLQAKLAASPTLRGKEIQVINAAICSGKQPQQVFTLADLLVDQYHFDVVVNLDGFNELTAVPNPGTSVLYSGVWPTLQIQAQDADALALAGQIQLAQDLRASLAQRLDESVLDASGLANLLWALLDQRLGLRIYRTELALRGRASADNAIARFALHGPKSPDSIAADPERVATAMLRLWVDSSIQMAELARHAGAEYIHLLQPNQYWPNTKTFSAQERAIAILPDSPLAKSVPDMYGRALAARSELRTRGAIELVDLTGMFKHVPQTVFFDDCCHLNPFGYGLLADRIVAEIVERMAARPLTAGTNR